MPPILGVERQQEEFSSRILRALRQPPRTFAALYEGLLWVWQKTQRPSVGVAAVGLLALHREGLLVSLEVPGLISYHMVVGFCILETLLTCGCLHVTCWNCLNLNSRSSPSRRLLFGLVVGVGIQSGTTA